jgi:hypothetical protein
VFRVAGGSQQVHDFNPGEENGLFWTVLLRHREVRAEFDSARAQLTLNAFDIDDYGNVGNALSGGDEIASATLTLSIRWRGYQKALTFSNSGLPTPFHARELQSVNSGATMQWSATGTWAGVSSRIIGHPNTADFAVLADESNGVFA